MIITKALEAEITQFLDNYWNRYLEGDLQTWSTYLTDDYKNIGGTQEEIWNSKKEIMDYTKAIIDQMVGVTELRNKQTQVFSLTPYILAHEFTDIYIKIENEWTFYGKFRLSSIIQRSEGAWQVVHQHGSYPDAKTEHGEAFAFDKISKENQDLKDAIKRRTAELENKTRELEIEAAVERVRTRTMAMQRSDELAEAASLLFQQFRSLGLLPEGSRVFFSLIDDDTVTSEVWTTKEGGILRPGNHRISLKANKHLTDVYESWKGRKSIYNRELTGRELIDYLKYIASVPYLKEDKALQQLVIAPPDRLIFTEAFFEQGTLGIISFIPLTPESQNTLIRFSKVFEQTYTRFLDLQKAEAQSREAQIEAALERVRSRTMGMQKSAELKEVIQVVYEQFVHLNINVEHTGFVMDYKTRDDYYIWVADKHGAPSQITIPYFDCEYYNRFNEAKEKGIDFFATNLAFEEKNKFYQKLFEYIPELAEEAREFYFSCPGVAASTVLLENVCLYIENFSGISYSDEENNTLMRFGKVFQQTYTRFYDLKRAEVQTQKANIEVALERVRARALAMQQPEELVEVAEVMRHEMGLLGVEELETSSIYINKENTDDAECWYALKDIQVPDKKLVADHFDLNYRDTWVGRQMLDFYQTDKKEVSIIMQGYQRKEWVIYCAKQSPVFKGYYGEVIPDRTYHLCKFSNGSIGAATPGEISDESWELLRRAASVFSLAYSRFKDLTKARTDLQQLKEEKQRAETALTELKTTQKQLIQSEKMASLGELTAGIAHEIQNPLNFVNNFSDVNKELLEELNREINSGNMEEVKEIAKNLIENEIKINHHGKRADSIVKGMLQHSRSSSGQKEPTDINALVDEFLRLAYHGLRAKDKSFNATLKTTYDEKIGNINIVPQDIGRVMLNLITNAFYAVGEKKKNSGDDYEPTVLIRTKKSNEKIEVWVEDNGNGIPSKVLDKIFQPFFTTKPTGEGTGLGLSLSYDIIKAHAGEINVETKDGEGSKFILKLPDSK